MKKPVCLVVEDDSVIRLDLTGIVEDAGYLVEEAADADAALDRLKATENPVALLLTDIRMPGIVTGEHLALAARQIRPETRVVVVTAFSDDLLSLPKDVMVLTKPVSRAALLTLLHALKG